MVTPAQSLTEETLDKSLPDDSLLLEDFMLSEDRLLSDSRLHRNGLLL